MDIDDYNDNPLIYVVIVGDDGCGKTSLVKRYLDDSFYGVHEPTTSDTNKSAPKDMILND